MGIAVSGVDQRSPGAEEGVQDGVGVVLVGSPAEGIGSQHQRPDVQIGARDARHKASSSAPGSGTVDQIDVDHDLGGNGFQFRA